LLVFAPWAKAQSDSNITNPIALKNLSLEELSQIEVTTPSKLALTIDAPEEVRGADESRCN